MNDKSNEEINNGSEEKYDLYTEQIVSNPWKRVRKVAIHISRIVGSAVLFGVIAGIIMVLINMGAGVYFSNNEENSSPPITIPTDKQSDTEESDVYDSEYEKDTDADLAGEFEPSLEKEGNIIESDKCSYETKLENSTGINVADMEQFEALLNSYIAGKGYKDIEAIIENKLKRYRPGIEELEHVFAEIKVKATELNKSIVTFSMPAAKTDILGHDYIPASQVNEAEGLIVAEDKRWFYVLASYESIKNADIVWAIFNDGSSVEADFVKSDATTGLAIVKCRKYELGDYDSNKVKTAVLGNSYIVSQGEPLILRGNIYSEKNMVTYGIASATQNTLMDTDSSYRILSTNVNAGMEDSGIIANIEGEVVGIIISGREGLSEEIISGYGISELKVLIERLINGKGTPYVGIKPQNITDDMKKMYNMEDGVYVYEVEPDSPAYISGIQSGDIINAVNDKVITNIRDFQNALFAQEPGTVIECTISRPGAEGYREVVISVEIGVEN